MVSVSLGPEGVAGGALPPEPAIGVSVELPVLAMRHPIMRSTQEDQAVGVGVAAQVVFVDVVGVAPAGWAVAAGEGAAVIAGGESFALFRGDGAGGAGEVERVALLVHHDRSENTVAGELAGGVAGERSHPRQPPDRGAVAEQVARRAAIRGRQHEAPVRGRKPARLIVLSR